MSEVHPVVVGINVVSTFDGSPVSAEITLESTRKEYFQEKTNSILTLALKPDGYNIKASSENYRPTSSFISVDSYFKHEITISLRPVGSFGGFVRHSASMKPIPGITMTLTGRDFNETTTTDETGFYEFKELISGKYKLSATSEEYQSFEKDYYVDAEVNFIESITLLPFDISTIHIGDFNSYSVHGKRHGKIAYYTDSTYVKIKKNLNGDFLIEQSYSASGKTGKSLILLKGDESWMAEGVDDIPDNFIPQTREFVEAVKLLTYTNEDLLDYINQLRFTDYAKITVVGEETINNVLCDKVHVYVNDPGSWIGWVDFDMFVYVMKAGRLPGLPTKIVGVIRGSDEVGHKFTMNVDLSITDIGGEFQFPQP